VLTPLEYYTTPKGDNDMNDTAPTTTQRSSYGLVVFGLGFLSLLVSLLGSYSTLWSFLVPFVTSSLDTVQNSVANSIADYAWYALLGATPFALIVIAMGIGRRWRGHEGIAGGVRMALVAAFIAEVQVVGWLVLYTSPHVVKLSY
jgi:hypothetical protein